MYLTKFLGKGLGNMANKYTWVLVNFILSLVTIACLFIFKPLAGFEIEGEGDIAFLASLAFLAFNLAPFYWLYRTIIYWRKCIQADNPAFAKIVKEMTDDNYIVENDKIPDQNVKATTAKTK